MKKVILWVVGIIIVIGVIGAFANGGKPTSNSDTGTDKSNQPEATKSPAEVMTISNSTVKAEQFGSTQVVGEIKNNDTRERSATLKATFYDKEGKIMGTAAGAINAVAPGQTKTFTLLSTDKVTGYANFKVEVDTLI